MNVGYANFADLHQKSVTIATSLEWSWKEGRIDHWPCPPICVPPILKIWWRLVHYILTHNWSQRDQ